MGPFLPSVNCELSTEVGSLKMTTRRGVESSREILKHFVSSVKTSLSSQSIRWWCQWKVANYLSRGVSDIGNTAPGLCGHYLLVLCQSIVHHASIHERINPSNLLHTMDVCSDTLEPRLHPNLIHLTFICKLKCKMLNGLAGQEKLYCLWCHYPGVKCGRAHEPWHCQGGERETEHLLCGDTQW